MQELIKYISDILNIKTESVYTIQDMTEELSKIKDIVAYRSYIKDNLDSIDYKTGFQKFLLLTQKYLRLEYSALHPEDDIRCKQLVKEVRANIFSATYDKRHISDYMSISTNEINIFKAIGNNVDIEKLLESNELYDTILKNRISQSLKNPYKNLPNRLKEITQKVLNTNEKVEANFARRF